MPHFCQTVNFRHYQSKQRGAALMVMLVIMVMGAATFLVSSLSLSALKNKRQENTAAALAQAKEALIGYAASRTDGATNPRPGELPCPDTNAPGSANYGTQASSCVAGAIGRLPWKTLGIEELKDGYGETLWYVIDGSFRRRNSNNQPINSDTRATMLVYDRDGATLLTPSGSEAVAIIFSPGPILGTQQRGTTTEQTTASNYLDNASPPAISVARSNAVANGPFVQGTVKDANGAMVINDSLLIITAHDLMQVIEKRVAMELKTLLGNYFATNGYYPYPAKFNDPNCLDVGSTGYVTNCQSDSTQCRGRLPDTATTATPTPDWIGVPGWFYYNLWGQVIYYAVGTSSLASAPANCSATLTVNGTAGARGLFIMPGTPLGAIVRNTPSQSIVLGNYLEDAMNQDGWTAIPPNTQVNADSYATPTAASNDRMQQLP